MLEEMGGGPDKRNGMSCFPAQNLGRNAACLKIMIIYIKPHSDLVLFKYYKGGAEPRCLTKPVKLAACVCVCKYFPL